MAQKAAHDAKPPRDVGVVGAIAGRLFWLAMPVALCTAAYLIYNFFASRLGVFPVGPGGGPLTAEQQAHITRTIHITSLVLTIAGSLAALFAMIRYYDSDTALFGLIAAGLVAYLGVPMLIHHHLSVIGRVPNAVTNELAWAFQAFGKVSLLVGGVKLVLGLLIQFARRTRRVRVETPKGPAVRSNPGMLSPCWELSKCREHLREACPNYKDRKTCWRRKSGCGCDPQLAKRLAWAKSEYAGAVDAIEERAQTGSAAPSPGERRALASQRTAMCRECPIYLEHQDYKYRTLQWLMYPLTVGLIWVLWEWIDTAYDWTMDSLNALMRTFVLLPEPAGDTFANQILGIDVQYLVIFCLAIFLVTFLLTMLERWVFQWKL
jgi:hypothetical protein